MVDVAGAPIQSLDEGGYLVALTDEATPDARRVRVADLAAAAALAQTALQPEDVDGLVGESFVPIETHTAAIAALQAQIAALQVQVSALSEIVNPSASAVFVEGLFDAEVFN